MSTQEPLGGYCGYVLQPSTHPLHRTYHDTEYGFPVMSGDHALFERLILEINQAGLSWETILKKRETFRSAYHNFDIQSIANFTQADIDRLLQDPGIIRNRLKVNAAISNAQTVFQLQSEFDSFQNWLNYVSENVCHLDLNSWVKTFKKTFRFTGGEITNSFLMSTGYLPGAHEAACPIYSQILPHSPAWSALC